MKYKNIKESLFYNKIKPCIEKYLPKYSNEGCIKFESPFEFSYGHSGFRDKFETNSCDLINALNKSGIFMGLLFIKYNYEIIERYKLFDNNLLEEKNKYSNIYNRENIKWKNVGIVITASHNPHDENGVKLLDCRGKQINETYEKYLMNLTNNHLRYLEKNEKCTIDDIVDNIINYIAYIFEKEINLDIYDNEVFNNIKKLDYLIYNCNINNKLKANICIGFDTRDSGIILNAILIESLNCLNIEKCINNMCYVTTPCMHFIINFLNNVFDDDKIDTTVIKNNDYTIHKKQNDLDYLKNFKLKDYNSIKNLYYVKDISNFLTGDSRKLYIVNKNENFINDNIIQENNVNLYAYNTDIFYFDYFIHIFKDLYYSIKETYNILNYKEEKIYVDCSNGVASLKIDNFDHIFKMLNKKIIKINSINDKEHILNFECGSEYVYSKKKLPANAPLESNCKFCSFDGDADRIIYFFLIDNKCENNNLNGITNALNNNAINEDKKKEKDLVILDGSKIVCLFLECIVKILCCIKINKKELNKKKIEKIDINIIQTAYLNSACINYLNSVKERISGKLEIFEYININIIVTKTGIKYLEMAAQKSPIGIFFEPNGHGTIYTDINQLNKWSGSLCISNDVYFATLKKYLLFFSQTAGDAIIDFIAIELSLSFLNLTINQWNAFYKPFPSLYINLNCSKLFLKKLQVHPQNEEYLIEPKYLQQKINEIVNNVDPKCGRCFIRPSGTEILIRIFAEAETFKKVNEILEKVKRLVCHYMDENKG